MACRPLVDEGDALRQLLVRVHDRSLRDADRAVVNQRLDEQREREPAGAAHLPAEREDVEARDVDAVVAEDFFRQRLVVRQRQAARVAARVGELAQFQIADDVRREKRVASNSSEEVVVLRAGEVLQRDIDAREIVRDADGLHLVAVLAQVKTTRPPSAAARGMDRSRRAARRAGRDRGGRVRGRAKASWL